jgi:thioredoxin-like negative regulator of GroEL
MNEHLFESLTINDIPTVAVFLNGREAALQSGAVPAPAMVRFIRNAASQT